MSDEAERLFAERALAQVASVEALVARWDEVLVEVTATDPRWILDKGVMALATAANELRCALDLNTPPGSATP